MRHFAACHKIPLIAGSPMGHRKRLMPTSVSQLVNLLAITMAMAALCINGSAANAFPGSQLLAMSGLYSVDQGAISCHDLGSHYAARQPDQVALAPIDTLVNCTIQYGNHFLFFAQNCSFIRAKCQHEASACLDKCYLVTGPDGRKPGNCNEVCQSEYSACLAGC